MATGATLSHLTALPYDFVVGTTQLAINKAMFNYVQQTTFAPVQVCFTYTDDDGDIGLGDCNSIIAASGVSNLFELGNSTFGVATETFQSLANANFAGGAQFEIGIPPGFTREDLPDIVNLQGGESKVDFQMVCKEFTVIWAGGTPIHPEYISAMQDPNFPWIYNATVNLNLEAAPSDGGVFVNLPPAVQAQVNNLQSGTFSIQQLLFDLAQPGLSSAPNLASIGLSAGTTIYQILNDEFIVAYGKAMQTSNTPVLGITIVPNPGPASTLELSAFNFEVMPYLAPNGAVVANPTLVEQELFSLNYVCVTDNAPLPPNTPLAWNWVDQSQLANGATPPDGAISIARNQFANVLARMLQPTANLMSVVPRATVVPHDLGWIFTYTLTAGNTPNFVPPNSTSGPQVMAWTFTDSSSDIAGPSGAPSAKTTFRTNFNMTVEFAGSSVTITQHMIVFISATALATTASGNIFDKTYVDTYTIVGGGGPQLVVNHTSSVKNSSVVPSVNAALNFFLDINGIFTSVEETMDPWLDNIILNDLPINFVQNFVFPGGNTFNFTNFVFSNFQDLVASINYLT